MKWPAIIAQGDQALEQRRKAAATRADHRVRNITALIEDINSAHVAGRHVELPTTRHVPSRARWQPSA